MYSFIHVCIHIYIYIYIHTFVFMLFHCIQLVHEFSSEPIDLSPFPARGIQPRYVVSATVLGEEGFGARPFGRNCRGSANRRSTPRPP